jgi:hypothetical protein
MRLNYNTAKRKIAPGSTNLIMQRSKEGRPSAEKSTQEKLTSGSAEERDGTRGWGMEEGCRSTWALRCELFSEGGLESFSAKV